MECTMNIMSFVYGYIILARRIVENNYHFKHQRLIYDYVVATWIHVFF